MRRNRLAADWNGVLEDVPSPANWNSVFLEGVPPPANCNIVLLEDVPALNVLPWGAGLSFAFMSKNVTTWALVWVYVFRFDWIPSAFELLLLWKLQVCWDILYVQKREHFSRSSLLRSELQQHGASVPVCGSLSHTLLAEPQGCCSTRARSRPSLVEGRLFH